ncbi:MAG: hypothetical protein ACREON_15295 [Gemmatimonadaceae bacterium]
MVSTVEEQFVRMCRRLAIALFLSATVGCGAEPTLPVSDELLLLLVLSPQSADAGDTVLFALLVTVGTPIESEYRLAERFEMRRLPDGATFAWRPLPVSGRAPIDFDGTERDSLAANYALGSASSTGELGRGNVRAGETYELRVETGGRVIRGRVTVPQQITPSLIMVEGRLALTWPPVMGAASYVVNDGRFGGTRTTDTVYFLSREEPDEPRREIRVRAVEQNLHEYLFDPSRERSGLDSGFGVFGALSRHVLLFAPDQGTNLCCP